MVCIWHTYNLQRVFICYINPTIKKRIKLNTKKMVRKLDRHFTHTHKNIKMAKKHIGA